MNFLEKIFSSLKPNLKRMIVKKDVKGLIKCLKYKKDPNIQRAAAQALGEIRDARAVLPLIETLEHWWSFKEGVTSAAAHALGEIKDARAVDPLIRALRVGRDPICSAAALSLGAIGDARAVMPLIEALRKKDVEMRDFDYSFAGVRIAAKRALVLIGRPAVEPLIEALRDEDPDVRRAAAYALGDIGDARAVNALTVALKDGEERVRKAAAKAVEQIGGLGSA